jgi:uncharacterized protein (TIGR02246 family)
MKRVLTIVLLAQLVGGIAATAKAGITEGELMEAATTLSRQYDASFAAKDPAAMAALYVPDGVLISPAGPIFRGREELISYYTKRFASGARGHAIKVLEVHVQGNGGYALAEFSVTALGPTGELHESHGSIVSVYQHDTGGWHLRLVAASIPASAK